MDACRNATRTDRSGRVDGCGAPTRGRSSTATSNRQSSRHEGGPTMKKMKGARHRAIAALVDHLEATLADCAHLIVGTDHLQPWRPVSPETARAFAISRTRLNMVELSIEAERADYFPGNHEIQPELIWLGDHCLKLVEVQALALGGLMDVSSLRYGAVGAEARYLDEMSRYFATIYDEHRLLTEVALGDDAASQREFELGHVLTADERIADFHKRAAEFEAFRRAYLERRSEGFAREVAECENGTCTPELRGGAGECPPSAVAQQMASPVSGRPG